MHVKYESLVREPLVDGHKTYAQVTEDIISPIERKPGRMWYVGFFFSLALILIYGAIFMYRWLDYWEILPNEILHHHGPWSDLERFPTMNLKFDKEIPDILEYMMLRAGRLVLHVTTERRAIILDNVLFINAKEEQLKKLMSRMEVRVTTDQENAEPM